MFSCMKTLHILSTLEATNSKPSEYKKLAKWEKNESFSLLGVITIK